jgi:phage gp29-like protein
MPALPCLFAHGKKVMQFQNDVCTQFQCRKIEMEDMLLDGLCVRTHFSHEEMKHMLLDGRCACTLFSHEGKEGKETHAFGCRQYMLIIRKSES